MNIHDEKWISFQIENYEIALEIAIRAENDEKIKEYRDELERLKDVLKRSK